MVARTERARMGLPRHGGKEYIAKTGQPRQDSQDRTAKTGQSVQDRKVMEKNYHTAGRFLRIVNF